jgi:hypothetical protein
VAAVLPPGYRVAFAAGDSSPLKYLPSIFLSLVPQDELFQLGKHEILESVAHFGHITPKQWCVTNIGYGRLNVLFLTVLCLLLLAIVLRIVRLKGCTAHGLIGWCPSPRCSCDQGIMNVCVFWFGREDILQQRIWANIGDELLSDIYLSAAKSKTTGT